MELGAVLFVLRQDEASVNQTGCEFQTSCRKMCDLQNLDFDHLSSTFLSKSLKFEKCLVSFPNILQTCQASVFTEVSWDQEPG